MSYMEGTLAFSGGRIEDLSADMFDLVDGGSVASVATHVATVALIGAGAAALSGAEPVAIGLGILAGGAAIVAGLAS